MQETETKQGKTTRNQAGRQGGELKIKQSAR